MAFSPETYALLLKKIEEGGGGDGRFGAIVTTAMAFGEGSHYAGELMYAQLIGSKWVGEYNNGYDIIWTGDKAIRSTPLIPLPDDENTKLFWVYYDPWLDGVLITRSGAISQAQTTVWVDDGTYGQSAYEITGIAHITLDNS